MTKHWPEQSLLAPPALSHLGENPDHQLDFDRNVQQSFRLSGVAPSSPAQHWPHQPVQMEPQQPARLEKRSARSEHPSSTAGFTEKVAPPGSSHPNAEVGDVTDETATWDRWNSDRDKGNASGGKKKNYQRYPKPPYSYLAMIAMVIQRSPEKKLTLSEVKTKSHMLNYSLIYRMLFNVDGA